MTTVLVGNWGNIMEKNMHLRDAIDYVLHQGEDGNEHAVLLRPDMDSGAEKLFTVILLKDGSKSNVDFTEESRVGNEVFQPGDLMVHNHPSCASLSLSDIAFSWLVDVNIMAVAKTGSVFLARALKPLDEKSVDYVEAKIYRTMCKCVSSRLMTEADCKLIYNHCLNVGLQRAGFIAYNCQLSDVTIKAMENFKGALTKLIADLR